MSASDIYQKILMDHFRSPRCKGRLGEPQASIKKTNPLCGDKIYLEAKLDTAKNLQIAFEAEGCSISQASASILSERCKGKSLEQVADIIQTYKQLMAKGSWKGDKKALGDLYALHAIKEFPARLKCAALAWEALEDALAELK